MDSCYEGSTMYKSSIDVLNITYIASWILIEQLSKKVASRTQLSIKQYANEELAIEAINNYYTLDPHLDVFITGPRKSM